MKQPKKILQIRFWLLLYLIACALGSCESDMVEEIEYLKSSDITIHIEPRTMLKTICKDAFVTVSGGGVSYSVYKGTTCRTCAESEPLGQGEYEAGGFPQYGNATDRGTGGMGKRYYIGDHWYFEFPHLKDIYASTSNLNVMEKSSLEYALQTITKRPADFSKVYQKLLATKKLIKFQINPKAISNAQYNKDNISIEFKDSYAIDGDMLMEELLHAAQHLVYYGEAMDNKYKDYEFEVKCFWDCSYWIAYIYI